MPGIPLQSCVFEEGSSLLHPSLAKPSLQAAREMFTGRSESPQEASPGWGHSRAPAGASRAAFKEFRGGWHKQTDRQSPQHVEVMLLLSPAQAMHRRDHGKPRGGRSRGATCPRSSQEGAGTLLFGQLHGLCPSRGLAAQHVDVCTSVPLSLPSHGAGSPLSALRGAVAGRVCWGKAGAGGAAPALPLAAALEPLPQHPEVVHHDPAEEVGALLKGDLQLIQHRLLHLESVGGP